MTRLSKDFRWGFVIPIALAGALLCIAVVAGIAYAFYTAQASGSGSATLGSMASVTIATVTSQTPNSYLSPGEIGEVILNVDNPNSAAMDLTSVIADGSISVSGGSGCTAANSGVSFSNQPGLSISLPANATTLVRLPGAASMSTTSANGCQGANFSIPVTISVSQP
jgi:hypothetical protein